MARTKLKIVSSEARPDCTNRSAFLESVFAEHLSDPVSILNPDLRVVDCNQALHLLHWIHTIASDWPALVGHIPTAGTACA